MGKYFLLGSFVIAGGLVSSVWADQERSGLMVTPAAEQGTRAVIVTRPVVEPAAMVSRELSDQSTWVGLIEVRRTPGLVVYLDPKADYIRQGDGPIGEDHFIVKAQRQGRSISAPGVTVYRSGKQSSPQRVVRPSMILLKPEMLQQENAPGQMPSAPSAPKKIEDKRSLTRAE